MDYNLFGCVRVCVCVREGVCGFVCESVYVHIILFICKGACVS